MPPLLNEILTTLIYPSIAAIALGLLRLIGAYVKERGRAALVAAVERQAGAIALETSTLDRDAANKLANEMADLAEETLKKNFAETLKKLGEPAPGTLSQMVRGELGKLLTKNGVI